MTGSDTLELSDEELNAVSGGGIVLDDVLLIALGLTPKSGAKTLEKSVFHFFMPDAGNQVPPRHR